jgi:tetratricopeptide (TPR) repeat protein
MAFEALHAEEDHRLARKAEGMQKAGCAHRVTKEGPGELNQPTQRPGPAGPALGAVYGRDLYLVGRDDEAFEQIRKTLEIDSTFIDARMYLGWLYARKRRFDEAIDNLQQAYELLDILAVISSSFCIPSEQHGQ